MCRLTDPVSENELFLKFLKIFLFFRRKAAFFARKSCGGRRGAGGGDVKRGGRRNPVCRRAGQRGRKGHKGKNLIDEQNGAGLPTWQARPVFCLFFARAGISTFRGSVPVARGRSEKSRFRAAKGRRTRRIHRSARHPHDPRRPLRSAELAERSTFTFFFRVR